MKEEVVMPKVQMQKYGKNWRVTFTIGYQTFGVESFRTKKENEWLVKMLKEAFGRINPPNE